jgi:hypothetical protein
VDHTQIVGVVERRGHLAGERHGLVDRQLLLSLDLGPKRLALNMGHDVVEEPVSFTRIVEPQDVGVVELCGDSDFPEEPRGTQSRGEVQTHDLYRHLPVVLEVLGEVDGGHAAGAEAALDLVAVGEGR